MDIFKKDGCDIGRKKKVKLICINFAYGFSSMGIDGKKDSSKDQCCVL